MKNKRRYKYAFSIMLSICLFSILFFSKSYSDEIKQQRNKINLIYESKIIDYRKNLLQTYSELERDRIINFFNYDIKKDITIYVTDNIREYIRKKHTKYNNNYEFYVYDDFDSEAIGYRTIKINLLKIWINEMSDYNSPDWFYKGLEQFSLNVPKEKIQNEKERIVYYLKTYEIKECLEGFRQHQDLKKILGEGRYQQVVYSAK